MGEHTFLTGPRVSRLRGWASDHPGLVAVALLLLLFGGYLPTTSYDKLYFDTNQYWTLGRQYGKTGSFELLSFGSPMRGYLFPLLLMPFAVIGPHINWEPIELMRPLGALMAAVLFGALGPGLWRAVAGPGTPAVSLGRRLLFGALGFALWRDYFNFSLTDFPALIMLATGLWALLAGKNAWAAVFAGMAFGASANTRPLYIASLPFVGLLALLPQPSAINNEKPSSPGGRRPAWGRLGAVVLGLALVLAPQAYLNLRNFGERTPWVLARDSHYPSGIYLQQLQWGLQYQKYETNVGHDYPRPQMFFHDPQGAALFAGTGLPRFTNTAQYLALARQHPGAIAAGWLRHVFNGLDIQYPSPYVLRVYVPTWPLAWLNYTVLLGGAAVLLSRWLGGRHRLRSWLVLAALFTSCVGVLPVAIECRYLLPLHLLLLAAMALGAHPLRAWRTAGRGRRAAWVVGYSVLVAVAFTASISAQQQLERGGRTPFSASPSPPKPSI